MTPKEKAQELIRKVSEFSDYEVIDDKTPKIELALIIVNEILNTQEYLCSYNNKNGIDPFFYWQQVKKEIKKI